jgi:hypothetical protein
VGDDRSRRHIPDLVTFARAAAFHAVSPASA